ncbi:cysteine proteinase [Rhodotorula sp. JG-1b]|nr:cysteine proteinase [Rhodotorula sp. JG-1b]
MATTTVTETRTSAEVAQAHAPRLANQTLRMGACSHYASWLKAHHHHLALQRLTAATHASFQLQALANYKSAATSSPAPSCSTCATLSLRPYFCLTCEATFCRHETASDHAASHAANEQHHLAWDLRAQALYCFGCNDHVRNPAVERFLATETISHADSNQAAADSHRAGKRKRVNTSLSLAPPTAFGVPANLPARGIRNLGNSCYMSVVLQTFLANPFLRAYFLADRHNRYACARTLAGEACLSCELDLLFSEVSPSARRRIFTRLNLLHSSSVLHHDETAPADAARCPCIVHSTFAGESRSKITCGRCHHQSETLEPFLDLSLDLRDRTSGEMAKTLADCLRSYTAPENLPSKYSCAACGDGVPTASKRLSIKSLPSVLCIQFKRFEITNQAHKIDTPIRYPLQLDMGPYLTDHLEYPASYKPSNATRFGLMAVIAHEGTLSQGHYTCYIRGGDDFFAVDDEKVRRASIGEVLAAKAYLVVYSRI